MTIKPHPLIPSGSVAVIDRIYRDIRDDVCEIQRKPIGVDAGGAPISGSYTTVEVVECDVRPPQRVPVEVVAGGRVGPSSDYEIFMPRETVIRSDDRVVVNGRTMEIVDDEDAVSHGFQLKVRVKATAT